VAIARGTILKPRILLLDEPTAALDPPLAQQVLDNLIILNHQEQLTVVMVNHHPQQLRHFAQRIIQLEAGQLKGEEILPAH
jgi:ABC-type methionine transport system ATPase subunit